MKILLTVFFITLSSVVSASPHCQVSYDELGIPKIHATNDEAFYYCFGVQHGQDRAWEMDFFRRSAQGRNAEVLGFSHLKSDLMMRLLNLEKLAVKIWAEMPAEKKAFLEWYSAGVNAGFETGKNSQEFVDKGFSPEPWRGEDSLLVLLLQSFDQTRRTFWTDYVHQKAVEKWGERAETLFDDKAVPWFDTILKPGEYHLAVKQKNEVVRTQSPLPQLSAFPHLLGEESGSNNWAVTKSRSQNGSALFANDPHLDLVTPMFWYWIHIESNDRSVIGASLPGVPVIPSGTNGKVAWGLTNAYINTADAVFVKDIPKEEVQTIRPLVWVKFGFLRLPFFFKSFQFTKSGHPFLPLELESEEPLLLRWSGYSLKAEDLVSMFDLPEVKDVSDMDKLLKKIGLPAWNFTFADSRGEIGMRVVGKAYRHSQPPFGIAEVSYQDLMKEEFLSPEERPSVLKPKRDYVYTANHRHWPADAFFHGGDGYSFSFRGFRINELLSGAKHDVESFKKIQCDTQAVDARFFVPLLLTFVDDPLLKSWDYQVHEDNIALPLYRRWMDLMMEKWEVNEIALWHLLNQPDDSQKVDIQKLHLQARQEVNGRSWKQIHRLMFPHLSKNEDWVFSPEIAGVGDNQTVNPGTSRWNSKRQRYEQNSGASMRMIVELKERPVIHLGLPGLNREYTMKPDKSPWEDWRNCLYNRIEL